MAIFNSYVSLPEGTHAHMSGLVTPRIPRQNQGGSTVNWCKLVPTPQTLQMDQNAIVIPNCAPGLKHRSTYQSQWSPRFIRRSYIFTAIFAARSPEYTAWEWLGFVVLGRCDISSFDSLRSSNWCHFSTTSAPTSLVAPQRDLAHHVFLAISGT